MPERCRSFVWINGFGRRFVPFIHLLECFITILDLLRIFINVYGAISLLVYIGTPAIVSDGPLWG